MKRRPRAWALAAVPLLTVFGCASVPPEPQAVTSGYILSPDEGTRALAHLIKVEPNRGAHRLGLGTQRLRGGRGIPLHIHDGEDEVLYVVSGRGVGVVGAAEREVVAGSLLYVPQGAWHGIRAAEDMEIMWVVSPPNFARYLREWNDAGAQNVSEAKWQEIAEKHEYADGRAFLHRVLAGTQWRDTMSAALLVFDRKGTHATATGGATLEIQDESAPDLGFIALWRPDASASPETVVLTYDFATGNILRLRWRDMQRTVSLTRER